MPDSEIHIRSFEPDDLHSVAQLIHRTIDTCYTGVYPSRAVDFFKEFHSRARILGRHDDGHVLVACMDGTIVATGAVVDDEISGMFVNSERQGCGIGSLIMERLEQAARDGGRSSARLDISLPSREFYEHYGYRVLAERSIDVGQGQRLEYWAAEKSLGPMP